MLTEGFTMKRHAEGRVLSGADRGVGLLIFDHPEKHNAITVEMWQGVAEALQAFEDDPTVRVVMLSGAGDKAFVSGGDISQFGERRGDAAADQAYREQTSKGRDALARFAKPTIASIHGYCLGGGLAIAMDADIRVAGRGAQFGIPAARLGIAYGSPAIRKLVGLVGPSEARLILYTGQRFGAAEALRIGLVNSVVDDAELDAASLALAHSIAANAPLSVEASKFTIDELSKEAAARDVARVESFTRTCMDSADYREGRTAFMEKRKPVFRGC